MKKTKTNSDIEVRGMKKAIDYIELRAFLLGKKDLILGLQITKALINGGRSKKSPEQKKRHSKMRKEILNIKKEFLDDNI